MRSVFLTATALLFVTSASAQPMAGMGHAGMATMPMDGASASAQSQPEQSMEQQMAQCSTLEALQKQGKTLSPAQKQQNAACQKMNEDMGTENPAQPAPNSTLDR